MNIMNHPILTDTEWRKQLRAIADEVQKRREDVILQRISEGMALRRISDHRIADEILSKDTN